jgi:hypothetical protein
MLYMPRRIAAAWRCGRRSRSLYRHADLEALLDMPLTDARDLMCRAPLPSPLNLFQGSILRPRGGSSLDAETSSA